MRNAVKKVTMVGGILRVWECLNTPSEMQIFQNAYDKILELYLKKFNGVKPIMFLKKDYMGNYNLEDYANSAKAICNLARKRGIYLDRPNDPLSCLVLGIHQMDYTAA